VVQLIVAEVVAIPLDVTALITGAGSGVENVKLAEVVVPAESADITA
jgi:hypothetical protein